MHRLWVLLLLAGCGAPSPGAGLLSSGRYQQLLDTVRPNSQSAAWARACAWWRLGQARQARQEILVGLARDRRSVHGHRLLGAVEARLGFSGAALSHLQRSLKLRPGQPRVRRAVAALLRRRALQRVGPGMGPHQKAEAHKDLELALKLLPSERAQTCDISVALARPLAGTSAPRPERCLGPPPHETITARSAMPTVGGSRCRLPRAARKLEELRRRYLLVSCGGAQAALELEQRGCLREAGPIWTALMHEAPSDPRWYLMAARNHLALGRPRRARQQLVHHLYLAHDRAAALLVQARLMLAFGHRPRAARLAVEAMAFAGSGRLHEEAKELIDQCGALDCTKASKCSLACPPGKGCKIKK